MISIYRLLPVFHQRRSGADSNVRGTIRTASSMKTTNLKELYAHIITSHQDGEEGDLQEEAVKEDCWSHNLVGI
jgi:hypothetical protein